jgi:hypothetical protein
VVIINATRESGTFVFEPEFGPGEYHAYYLPHHSQQPGTQFWGVSVTYIAVNESAVSSAWRARAMSEITSGSPSRAQFVEFQPRTEFHRFSDMELVSTAVERAALTHSHPGAQYLLFPEDRRNALRLTNSPDLPVRWATAGPGE